MINLIFILIAYCVFTQWVNNKIPPDDIRLIEYGANDTWPCLNTPQATIQQALTAMLVALGITSSGLSTR